MSVEPGGRLGVYEIVHRLGSGAMGDVFRARDLRLGRDVALKVLPERFQDDPERRARFEAEALALSALNHPNVVTVYGAETHGDVSLIAMELVEGRTLRSLLADGPLPSKRALEIAARTAAGLAAAHARGVVHRDLKPENVMIGPGGLVKVVDFGIARRTLPAGEGGARDPTVRVAPHLTETGAIIGTAGYMSPEQVEGREADFHSDQFALGTVLHEMLSGKGPFRRASAGETLAAILRDDPPPLPPLPTPIAAPVAWILERCLAKDPAGRYGSTDDLARDLARAVDLAAHASWSGGPAVAVPASTPRRSPNLALGLLLLLPFLVAGAVWLGTRIARTSAPEFRKLTFRRGSIGTARFASGDKDVVYSAAWEGGKPSVFRSGLDAPDVMTLPFGDASLLAISARGQLALSLRPGPFADGTPIGTLGEASATGGTARELAEGVLAADFSPDGARLAVGLFDFEKGACRIEFPPGRVVYETAAAGWVSDLRVSRDGSHVGFLDHPLSILDDGVVAVLDAAGRRRALTGLWSGVQGLAWSAAGDRILFTATGSHGGARALFVVELDGRVRRMSQFPGSPKIHDVSRDGRILLSREERWIGMVRRSRDGRTEDVSWLDASLLADFSPDGRTILFTEFGESSPELNHVYVRRADGRSPVRLGEGTGAALSPDGAWALTILNEEGQRPRLVALPLGAGQPVRHPPVAVERIHWATWLPGREGFLLAANESGGPVRLWVQKDGGDLRAVSEGGIKVKLPGIALSPDGRRVAAIGADEQIAVYDVAGREKPRVLPGVPPGLAPVDFTSDGRTLFAYAYTTVPASLYRIDVESGRQTFEAELAPPDRTGLYAIPAVHVSTDGTEVAYSFVRILSELYLVDGL